MEIIKTCKVHGNLARDETYTFASKGKKYLRCKEYRREYYTMNLTSIRENAKIRARKFKLENPERVKEKEKKWASSKKGKEKAKKRGRILSEMLHDTYVKRILWANYGFRASETTKEIVEVQRAIILINRIKKNEM